MEPPDAEAGHDRVTTSWVSPETYTELGCRGTRFHQDTWIKSLENDHVAQMIIETMLKLNLKAGPVYATRAGSHVYVGQPTATGLSLADYDRK